MSRESQRQAPSSSMSRDRPYTQMIGINGKLRAKTMPIDEAVKRSFATRTWPGADREGRGERDFGLISKSREDELVSFTGTWIPPSK